MARDFTSSANLHCGGNLTGTRVEEILNVFVNDFVYEFCSELQGQEEESMSGFIGFQFPYTKNSTIS